MSFVDPPEPPEGGASLRAKDLKNRVCLFRPVALGEWPASEGKKAQPYVECDVWVLDRAGVVEEATGVRVAWWKAVDQLKHSMGQIVGAKPTEAEDNSIYLATLTGAARDVAAKVIPEIASGAGPSEWDGEEPI